MALKIWKDGAMTKIDTNLHKPVIFLNGDKYKLDKAYTFVNGQKQQIWGESGVQIDYISSTGVLGGGIVFSIGETWANVYNNNTIYRLNISNLHNPTVIQNINWGDIIRNNGFQSDTFGIFEAWNTSSHIAYKIKQNNTDGTLSVESSQTFTIPTETVFNVTRYKTNGYTGNVGNSFIAYYADKRLANPKSYLQHFLVNDSEIYTWQGVDNANVSLCQYSNTAILGCYHGAVGTATANTYTLTSLTASSSTVIQSQAFVGAVNSCYANTTNIYLCYGNGSGMRISKRANNNITSELYNYASSANVALKIIGEIDNNIYVLSYPYENASQSSEVKLLLLDNNDLSLIHEKTLPNDPFNENSGLPIFWINCIVKPQISGSGFLAVSTYDVSTLALRIARFSGLI